MDCFNEPDYQKDELTFEHASEVQHAINSLSTAFITSRNCQRKTMQADFVLFAEKSVLPGTFAIYFSIYLCHVLGEALLWR